jgi:spore maturation protein CgeB
MGAGTFLLTNPTDHLLNMFTPGLHLDVYRSVSECLKKIDHYLTHPHEREVIAANGCQQVQRKHSYDARARWMIEEGVVA